MRRNDKKKAKYSIFNDGFAMMRVVRMEGGVVMLWSIVGGVGMIGVIVYADLELNRLHEKQAHQIE